MKKTFIFTILLLFMVSQAIIPAYASNNNVINVTIDGKKQTFSSSPVMKNGSVMVPFRNMFEALGASIEYETATKTITATKKWTTIILQVGYTDATIDGKNVVLTQTPYIEKGVTYVPARFVSESLGGIVEWDSTTRTVVVKSAEAVDASLTKLISKVDVTPDAILPYLTSQNRNHALLLALQYSRSNEIINAIITSGEAEDFLLRNAITHRHKYAIEKLLKKGVSPNADQPKDMPLYFAAEGWKVRTYDAMGKAVDVEKPIDLSIVQMLLDYGAEKTPDILANAVKNSYFNHEVVLYLLESGFDPNGTAFKRVFKTNGNGIHFYSIGLEDTIIKERGEHYEPIIVTAAEVASWSPHIVALKNLDALVKYGADIKVLEQELLDRLLYLAEEKELHDLVKELQAAGAK